MPGPDHRRSGYDRPGGRANGLGWISLSAYWQSVIRGAFLLVMVVLQAKLMERRLNG